MRGRPVCAYLCSDGVQELLAAPGEFGGVLCLRDTSVFKQQTAVVLYASSALAKWSCKVYHCLYVHGVSVLRSCAVNLVRSSSIC